VGENLKRLDGTVMSKCKQLHDANYTCINTLTVSSVVTVSECFLSVGFGRFWRHD